MTHHLAIDLGAESGRALQGRFNGDRLSLIEIRRFPNTPVADASTLRWDVQTLWREIQHAVYGNRRRIRGARGGALAAAPGGTRRAIVCASL
jgi:sugar (pentulose or hexulose) kinase